MIKFLWVESTIKRDQIVQKLEKLFYRGKNSFDDIAFLSLKLNKLKVSN
jgi:hypothetical protein